MGDLRRNIHGARNLLGYWHNVKPQCRDIGHADVGEHGQRAARDNPAAHQVVRTPPRTMPSCSAKAAHPVRRGLSIQSLMPLEYWIVRIRGVNAPAGNR
jgi:hypothetical protein